MVHFGACVSFKSGPWDMATHAGLHRRMDNGARSRGQGTIDERTSGGQERIWRRCSDLDDGGLPGSSLLSAPCGPRVVESEILFAA